MRSLLVGTSLPRSLTGADLRIPKNIRIAFTGQDRPIG
jgi:hypothetical protein